MHHLQDWPLKSSVRLFSCFLPPGLWIKRAEGWKEVWGDVINQNRKNTSQMHSLEDAVQTAIQLGSSWLTLHEWTGQVLGEFLCWVTETVCEMCVCVCVCMTERERKRATSIKVWLLHLILGALKNWCFQTLVLEKTLESPLDSKEINQFILREIQPWIFSGRTKPETPNLNHHLMQTADSLGKTLMLGKIERRRRRGWQRMRWLNGMTDSMDMNLGELLGDGEGQGGLACCSPWGCKELDKTWQLNNNHA